jgi:tetratricopeptide (TPR) repeat protein/SAM-dependent methyltransferase
VKQDARAELLATLAVILHGQGRLGDTVASYRQCLAIQPDSAQFLSNLGSVLQDQGKLDEAIVRYRQALALWPQNADVLSNLGTALQDQGKLDEAVERYEQALALSPEHAGVLSNLGTALRGLGRLDDAVIHYVRALAARPRHADAVYNLATALHHQGRLSAAVSLYDRALDLRPDFAEARTALGFALLATGDQGKAMAVACQSLRTKETLAAKLLFVECVRAARQADSLNEVRGLVLRALAEPWCRPTDMSRVVVGLIKANPAVAGLLARPLSPGALTVEAIDDLAGEPLLMCLLTVTPVCDAELERLLTACRAALLNLAVQDRQGDTLTVPAIAFFSALARQCFINEYVFASSDEEDALAKHVRIELLAAIDRGAPVALADLLALASYSPLHSLRRPDRLLERRWPPPVSDMLHVQVAEPLDEHRRRAAVSRLTAIRDRVSSLVRQQYERNPYPRWVKADPVTPQPSIDHCIRQRFPHAPYRALGKPNPDILVAGCGTGRHPIETARVFPQGRVLAVDLSLTSLCYALRKTDELGLNNLEYGQADLLLLGSIGRRFEIVEAMGVLHHLADPAAGLRVLVALLRPYGLIRLGLYSERARRGIVGLRDHLAARGYSVVPEDIRPCRQSLLAEADPLIRRQLAQWTDMASTSECRDLLFPVQEHRFALPQVRRWLDRFGLTFIGFDTEPDVRRLFQARFPDPRAEADFRLWDQFEKESPDTFRGMYQFWAQKAGSATAD